MPSTKPQTRDPARPAAKARAASLRARAARVMAPPSLPAAFPDPPADLADACDWAVRFTDWYNSGQGRDGWTDQQSQDEFARQEPVWTRAITEPARDQRTVVAKARLLLQNCACNNLDEVGDQSDRLTARLSRDVIALSAHSPADAPLLALGQQFDVLHAEWRAAEIANREPSERYEAALTAVRKRREPTVDDLKAAWALPGVTEAHKRSDETFGTAADLALTILRSQAKTVQGLAVQARAMIPHVWAGGGFEEDAALGDDEDMAPEAVRHFIKSCCSAAGVDWQGRVIEAGTSAESAASDGLPSARPLIDGLDIAAQSMADLVSLRDIADTISNVAYGLAALPCSMPERGHPTVAGRFALWLAELACEIQDHAQTAARVRSPATEHDAERRLQAVAASVAVNGDPEETRALARDFEALAQMIEARSLARG